MTGLRAVVLVGNRRRLPLFHDPSGAAGLALCGRAARSYVGAALFDPSGPRSCVDCMVAAALGPAGLGVNRPLRVVLAAALRRGFTLAVTAAGDVDVDGGGHRWVVRLDRGGGLAGASRVSGTASPARFSTLMALREDLMR